MFFCYNSSMKDINILNDLFMRYILENIVNAVFK